MIGRRVLPHKVRVVFKDVRAIGLQQAVAKFLCRPAKLEGHYIISEIDAYVRSCFSTDRLRHSSSFFAELTSSPVTLGDGILRKKRRGVIRINVPVSALKKEAKRRPIEILFHC